MPTKENAETKQETKNVAEKVSPKIKKKQGEAVYFAKEFVTNAETLFQRKPECVRAALMEKGIEKCTKSEAQKIVEGFMKKEVR
ncbi:MAG: hypothetical protein K2N51_15580 [Lachnospiraceae bacterium]|nr:hypothetical protein [Lachnospiraceae bacterium]